MLTCYLYRSRIGAYLDGALDDRRGRAVAGHLGRCLGCAGEADGIRRLKSALAATPPPPDPDWTGFWPGIVRGIQDAPARTQKARPRSRPRPGWAYGGALAAALLVTVGVWQSLPSRIPSEDPVIVRSADTGVPDAKVMVYSSPDRDLTVVWVVGLDQ